MHSELTAVRVDLGWEHILKRLRGLLCVAYSQSSK